MVVILIFKSAPVIMNNTTAKNALLCLNFHSNPSEVCFCCRDGISAFKLVVAVVSFNYYLKKECADPVQSLMTLVFRINLNFILCPRVQAHFSFANLKFLTKKVPATFQHAFARPFIVSFICLFWSH